MRTLRAVTRLAVAALRGELVAVTVRGASMEPAYRSGDRVLVRRGGLPARGDVVVVEHLGIGGEPWRRCVHAAAGLSARRWMIKRVAAAPGDPVPREQVPALARVPETSVPQGRLVLLGDNKRVSFDSRRVGYVPAERVLGTVLCRLPGSAEALVVEPADARARSVGG
ncbi:S26 family signal peptidase [Nocardia sp. CDC159]|uniref:S26 family signal peptidase n=1 Tax=Nocardia pulmonis TaxID=2951408 RepID=A0A9X2E1J8_9NOCA|nr:MULTISPECIES: S26 family signal peptidase [Nocardia]MCM6771890.1 S26 family signal peptidase [Nocardia pulmonis]MCM6785452.1 S26 family signal peptidase [Nocardia sp. CDC159]